MDIGEIDVQTIQTILESLAKGLRRAETELADGRKFVGYYITDKQIRIDIIDPKG